MLSTAVPTTAQPAFDLKQTVGVGKWRGFWRLMTGYRTTYLVSTVSMGLAAILNTLTFLLIRYFVDQYLDAGNRTWPLWTIVASFLGLALAQGVFTFNSRRLAARTAEGIARRLRNYLYDHIQRLPFVYHDKTQTGECCSAPRPMWTRSAASLPTRRSRPADRDALSGDFVALSIWMWP